MLKIILQKITLIFPYPFPYPLFISIIIGSTIVADVLYYLVNNIRNDHLIQKYFKEDDKKDFLGDINNLNLNENYNNFYSFLTELTHEQLGAVVHISGSIVIFYCMMSVIFTIYGDKLIIKLELENKYPKIAKFIRIRRKFLEMTMIYNIFLIFCVLGVIIYINYLILMT
uniref:Uncharacterized protein n=1 Tax=Pleurotus citrinopileatus TaxID=98342 RepID=A0A2K9YPG5_PLECI|nr:hypothetical protein [Pleurotus citrinopileatus]AUW35273.1 hypothetical protein [Pleurotus citrinopileatus]